MGFMRHPNKGKPPMFLKFRSSTGLIVTTASFAVFTDIFLYSVIVPVIPFYLEEHLGVAADNVQYWVSISLAVYGAALLASSPIWGYLADRIQNRRYPMLFGLVLLTGSTIFLCLAKNIAMLLIGRILQGLSAALTWTVGLAMVVDTVDRNRIGATTGWIGTSMSVGILIGPLLGGVVYAKGGYYEVFAMCFGVLAVDIILRLIIIEVKEAKRWLDVAEPAGPDDTPSSSVSPVGDDEQGRAPMVEEPKENPHTAKAALGTFFGLLRKPRLAAALWGTLVDAIVVTAFESTLPLFVADTFGWTSIGAALVFLPLVVPSFISPFVGAFADRYGPKWPAAFGFLFGAPFLICLRFVQEDNIQHKVMLCGLLAGVGVCISFAFSPLMAEITWAVLPANDDDKAAAPFAQAYGLYNMAYSGGSLVGPILGGLIRDRAGWGTVGWSLGVIVAVTSITQFIWIGGTSSFKLQRQNR